MIDELLSQKIKEYSPANAIEQENVLQEMMQHYCLASLAKEGFFEIAEFQGGTCLRILHGLERYSEDLDFVLKKPDFGFSWFRYLNRIQKDCLDEGINFEILDKSETETMVKKAFLKIDSVGKLLVLQLPYFRHDSKKIKIKLEIDINPPKGSTFETSFISFPVMSAITNQTLESSFAGKSHALLCREYMKGRDWYDFLWYVNRKTKPNLVLLKNALYQQGPWAGKSLNMTKSWYMENLERVIDDLDWGVLKSDVRRFLSPKEQSTLELWNDELFLYHLNKLNHFF